MVTKILPNAVASGGPLQPEPSTRIFATPLPEIEIAFDKFSFIFAQAERGLFLGPPLHGHRGRAGDGRRTRQGAPFHNVSCAVSASP